jgi:hypothetical protein
MAELPRFARDLEHGQSANHQTASGTALPTVVRLRLDKVLQLHAVASNR